MPSRSTLLSRLPRRVATVLLPAALAVGALTAPAVAAPATVSHGSAIEVLAPYQGQTLCDPVAKPGVVRFRDLVLAAYPGTGDSGIVRACNVGGTSEHKEGRAWDWRVNTSNATQVLQVADLMEWLLAEDEFGNTAAMARRLGVMYVIWDSQVWKSYQAAKGWQPYTGASPHTDHVHFSFSWAAAYGETSYWTGRIAPVMPAPAPPPPPAPAPGDTATETPTATIEPAPLAPAPVMDTRALYEKRRSVKKSSLPGPWRRH